MSASKMISMPMICSVQTVHLSCTDTNTVSKPTKMRFHVTHVTYEFHRVHPKLLMSLWYVQCKPCTYLASRLALSPNRPNRAPPEPCHLGVRLTQTMHLSCVKIGIISKWTEQSSTRPTSPRSTIGCV
jgi:hypothetical protein